MGVCEGPDGFLCDVPLKLIEKRNETKHKKRANYWRKP